MAEWLDFDEIVNYPTIPDRKFQIVPPVKVDGLSDESDEDPFDQVKLAGFLRTLHPKEPGQILRAAEVLKNDDMDDITAMLRRNGFESFSDYKLSSQNTIPVSYEPEETKPSKTRNRNFTKKSSKQNSSKEIAPITLLLDSNNFKFISKRKTQEDSNSSSTTFKTANDFSFNDTTTSSARESFLTPRELYKLKKEKFNETS